MADNDLLIIRNPGDVITADDFNTLRLSLLGDFVGRDNPTGAVTPDQRLGTPVIPWRGFFSEIFINGVPFDPDTAAQLPNQIVSGAVRTTSGQPDFLRADGSTNQVTILASTTALVLIINNITATYGADVIIAALQTAPGANNTADINDVNLTGQESSKFQGEDDTIINIDNAGTEITDRIGQCASFAHGSSEIFFGFIKSATEITNVFRGFYLDSTGTPLQREVMSNNDVITLLETGWIFAEVDALTVDVTYLTPVVDFVEPASPALSQYWLDLGTNEWKRFGGTGFVVINRIPIGLVIIDTANAIATRSFDFSESFNDLNTFRLQKETDEIVRTTDITNRLSVYGELIAYDHDFAKWDITTDLESGFIEANSTLYYIYLTEVGENILSPIKPYNRPELRGKYHPYNTWRQIGTVFNDSSGDFDTVTSNLFKTAQEQSFIASGNFIVPAGVTTVDVEVWGAGAGGDTPFNFISAGGGAGGYSQRHITDLVPGQTISVTVGNGGAQGGGSPPGNGGASSFGSFMTANGGSIGQSRTTPYIAGPGGTATGGDLNLTGGDGFIQENVNILQGYGSSSPRGGPMSSSASTANIPGAGGAGAGAASGVKPGARGLVIIKWEA